MRRIMFRLLAAAVAAAAAMLAFGFNASPAQAVPAVEIGPIEVCNVVTFFGHEIFSYNCHTV